MQKQSYRIDLSIPQDHYETVIAECIMLGMAGNEEVPAGDRMVLKVYFADQASVETATARLKTDSEVEIITVELVENQDWLAKWRESMEPAHLAEEFWVSPTWLPPPESAKHWIKIEPKMAFGTGHHETTRLAAAEIIACRDTVKNSRILDIGTGSGVLCFTADACGAASCLGVEIDAQCCENLAENRRDNAAKGRVTFAIGSIDSFTKNASFNFVVMNMLITESAPLLQGVSDFLLPGGTLIWSGILGSEADEATEGAQAAGFALVTDRRENEWWCGRFESKR
jgi:ribosomal protein L11 methyltransferase